MIFCPHQNAGLIWDMTVDVALGLNDDASGRSTPSVGHESSKEEWQTSHGIARGKFSK